MGIQQSDCSIPCFILIDDNLGDLHLMEVALKRVFAHAKVYTFESGEGFQKAWKTMEQESLEIHACFVDYCMPGMSGKDVLRYMMKHAKLSCPVYLFSGALLPAMKKEMLEMGATDFLEKPIDFDALIELVSGLFAQQLPAA